MTGELRVFQFGVTTPEPPLEGEVGWYVPAGRDWCPRCGDTNYTTPARLCITCTHGWDATQAADGTWYRTHTPVSPDSPAPMAHCDWEAWLARQKMAAQVMSPDSLRKLFRVTGV